MSNLSFEQWETYVRETAGAFPYPPTPDIAGTMRQRLTTESRAPARPRWQLAWAVAIAIIVLAGLLAVPRVRAGLLEFLRIGAVRILLSEPTPTAATPSLTPTTAKSLPLLPPADATAAARPTPTMARPTATPWPSPTPLTSVLDLAGETTLAEAQKRAGFPIRLPTYPPDLGPPDRVFLQDLGGPAAVILVWLEPGSQDQVRLSLYQLGQGVLVEKGMPRIIRETTVHGQRALWTEGPYLLRARNGNYELSRLIEGHVLIWVEDEITYRLETDLLLEEAVRIAESLR